MRKVNHSFILIVGTLMLGLSIQGFFQTGYAQINQTEQDQFPYSNMSDNTSSNISESSSSNRSNNTSSNISESSSSNMSDSQSSSSSGISGELALMALNLEDIEDSIGNAQDAITNADTVGALDALSEIENSMSTLEKQPQILQDIKTVKDSLSNNDLQKATEDITKIQSQISQVKTQNPEIVDNDDNDEDSDD